MPSATRARRCASLSEALPGWTIDSRGSQQPPCKPSLRLPLRQPLTRTRSFCVVPCCGSASCLRMLQRTTKGNWHSTARYPPPRGPAEAARPPPGAAPGRPLPFHLRTKHQPWLSPIESVLGVCLAQRGSRDALSRHHLAACNGCVGRWYQLLAKRKVTEAKICTSERAHLRISRIPASNARQP